MKSLIISLSLFFCTFSLVAQNAQDEQAIRDLVSGMAEAWTDGNGEEWAKYFADEHDLVVWNGIYFKKTNPALNARSHQQLFENQYKDTKHYSVVDKISFIREDVALIHVLAAIVQKGAERPADPQVLWTGLLTKDSGDWKIVSFHNLDLEVLENEQMKKASPIPPQAMFSSWYESR